MASSSDSHMYLIPGGLALVFVIFGGIMAGVGHYRGMRDEASKTWPITEATVTGSSRYEYRKPGESRPEYRSFISYVYEVNGRKYEFRTSGSETRDLPGEGTIVPLRYDPEDPSDTRLPGQEPFPKTLLYVIGAGSVLITLQFWYLALRWRRAARAPSAA